MTFIGMHTSPTSSWWESYSELDLRGGKIIFISDDDEDMIEITYPDGMLIDVGKPTYDHRNRYYITVVPSDDGPGWSDPLALIRVPDKKDLAAKLQEAIWTFRTT